MENKVSRLVAWTEDCPNLKEVFEKAKGEGRSLIAGGIEQSESFPDFQILSVRDDYAVVSHERLGRFDEPKVVNEGIHGYGR